MSEEIRDLVIADIRDFSDCEISTNRVDRIVSYFVGLGIDALTDAELQDIVAAGSSWHLYDFLTFTEENI